MVKGYIPQNRREQNPDKGMGMLLSGLFLGEGVPSGILRQSCQTNCFTTPEVTWVTEVTSVLPKRFQAWNDFFPPDEKNPRNKCCLQEGEKRWRNAKTAYEGDK